MAQRSREGKTGRAGPGPGGTAPSAGQPALADAPSPADTLPVRDVPIVSSAHLVSARSVQLSEFEFGMIIANNAFTRWAVRCMAAAGLPDLTSTDVMVLHHVAHRRRAKKLADICFVLNYEDIHVVSYSLRKLTGLGVVRGSRVGKEVVYETTPAGAEAVARYRGIRDRCLVAALSGDDRENADIGELARVLRALSGLYDQAARSASSL